MIETIGKTILQPLLGVYLAEKWIAPKTTKTDFKYYRARNAEIVRRSRKLLSTQKARQGYSVNRALQRETQQLTERDVLAVLYEAEIDVERESSIRMSSLSNLRR